MKAIKQIIIKRVQTHEYDRLRQMFLEIRQACFTWEDTHQMGLYDFDELLKEELILCAYIGVELVGFASIYEPDRFIHYLMVQKDYRGLGVAKALINRAVEMLGTPMTLKCMKSNTRALDFYLHQGWTIQKEEECEQGPYYLMSYQRTKE